MCCLWVILFVKKLRNPPIQSPPTVTTGTNQRHWFENEIRELCKYNMVFLLFLKTQLLPSTHHMKPNIWWEKNPPFHARNFSSQCAWFNSLSIMTHDWNRTSYIYRKRISSGDIHRNTFPNWNWLQAPKAQSHTLNHAIHKQTKLRFSLIHLF